DRGGPAGTAAEVSRRRRGDYRCELCDRRDRWVRRLHQRGQRRPGDGAAGAAHRLPGDREADPEGGGPGGVSAAARAFGDGTADHDVLDALSWAATTALG